MRDALATRQSSTTTTTTKSNRREGIFLDKDRRFYSDRNENLWVDATIAAKALGVSTDQLYRAVRAGRCDVRYLRLGALLRFNARDLGLFDGQEENPSARGNEKSATVELARKTALIAQIKRKERIQAILDYTGLSVRILFGITSLIIGASEWFDPTFLPINGKPGIYIAIGLSFLSESERVISKIEKVAKALKS